MSQVLAEVLEANRTYTENFGDRRSRYTNCLLLRRWQPFGIGC